MAVTVGNRGTPDLLHIYLNDHRAGSVAGRSLAVRCSRSNKDRPIGSYLTSTFIAQIDDERAFVNHICDVLNVRPNALKISAAKGVEIVSRLKLNGFIGRYSPLSRVLEVEALVSGVHAKHQLWRVLERQARLAAADRTKAKAMVEQAEAQLAALERFHDDATAECFTTSAEAP
jgi:hypothetical protein